MKKRLMVVDDSRMVELQICKLLEGSEFEVTAYCENGEEAITCYQEIRPDVVTMDVIMPGIDGLETAKLILEDHPAAKIIIVSSLSDKETFSEASGIGAKAILYKPFSKENLIEALEKALV